MKNTFEDFMKFAVANGCNKSALEGYAEKNGLLLPEAKTDFKPGNYVNPSILEEREMHVTQMDVFSRLMMDRSIFFGTEVNSDVCNIIVAQLLYLKSVNKNPITMYINSPGGSVYDGYGVIDTMQWLKQEGISVDTVCTGLAASMGAMLLMCGTRGKRSMLPHARCMIHQPLGGCKGQATEILIEAQEIEKLRKELYEIIAQRSGQKIEKVIADCERDHWLTAEETKAYGLIDNIIPLKWD